MKTLPILVLIAALAFAAGPFLSSFSGFDPDLYPVPQINPPGQPAGYAFAIWGVIYLWLLVYAVFGLRAARDDPAWAATWPLMLISLGIGATWLFVAEVSPIWATILILLMALSAVLALFHAARGAPGWALALPIGLYAGWLTAASLVSIALLGAGYGVGPMAYGWAWIAVLVAVVLGLALQRAHRVPTFGIAVAWALFAVGVTNWGQAVGLAWAAVLGAAAVLALTARQIIRDRVSPP